ncbi:MAG: YgaP family membrane protein [Candidatus Kapaibacteriales bacterium]
MKKNMGSFDRTLRIILAVVVGILILTSQLSGLAAIILGIIAIIFLITGFVGFCPLYAPFKIQTIGKSNTKE